MSDAALKQHEQNEKGTWRRKRESELECGDDPQAMYATVIRNKESLNALWDFIVCESNPDLDQRILQVRDLMTRIIQDTLDFEEQKGLWEDEL